MFKIVKFHLIFPVDSFELFIKLVFLYLNVLIKYYYHSKLN